MQPFLSKEIYIHDTEHKLTVTIYPPVQESEGSADFKGYFTIESDLEIFEKRSMFYSGVDSVSAMLNCFRLVGIKLRHWNEQVFFGKLCEFKGDWPSNDPFLGFLPSNNTYNVHLEKGKSYL